ncbi:unnamed protein product [Nesidiocoris tenuis]|uniref:Uncharacterized protein n=1 Tax=Nesidiocoris tenuis TaxID=355587 RepID=A0A6H5GLX1_9HEMI|nr:unnamed protein product [Nesidiocoris tenuis]
MEVKSNKTSKNHSKLLTMIFSFGSSPDRHSEFDDAISSIQDKKITGPRRSGNASFSHPHQARPSCVNTSCSVWARRIVTT